MATEPLTKIGFALDDGPLTIPGTTCGETPASVETLWAQTLGGDRYKLRNIPFYTYGVSCDDIVSAKLTDGLLMANAIVERGGHSTYRLLITPMLEEQFLRRWPALEALGCGYEGATSRYIAVDVPPSADISAVEQELLRGESEGVWNFEEGHCNHQR